MRPFGLGFILGPFFGGVLGDFGVSYPAYGAAFLCIANFFLAIRILKESLPPEKRTLVKPRENRFERMFSYFRRPVIGPLLFVSFFTVFAFAHMEAVLFLLVKDRFGWGMTLAAFAFAYVGIVGAFTQGFLIRRLLPKFGERKLMVWGLVLSGLGLIAIGFAPNPYVLAVIVTVMSLGVGLRNPSLMGMLSLKASASEQGGVIGASQSLASLGRILGPPLGGYLYGKVSPESPFVVAGLATLVSLPVLWKVYRELPDQSLEGINTNGSKVASHSAADVTSQPVVITTRPRGSESPIRTELESKPKVEDLVYIGEYQLSNLITQRVQFLFVDLRSGSAPKPAVPLIVNSSMNTLIEDVNSRVPNKMFPIVVVCEDGKRSIQAATKLLSESFINVVVLRGGAPA